MFFRRLGYYKGFANTYFKEQEKERQDDKETMDNVYAIRNTSIYMFWNGTDAAKDRRGIKTGQTNGFP